eukprot:COSAG04_NODE_20878_length_384_cov_1.007018_2_plen_92_part_01
MDADVSRGIKFAEFAAFMRQNLPRRQPAESAAPATPRQEEEADPHPQMDVATPPTPAPDDNADDADEPEPPNTAIQMAAAAAEFVENQVKW